MESLVLDKACIHGATLAALLQSVISTGRNACDGLLLGHTRTHVQQNFQDDDSGMVTVEEHEAYITATMCNVSTCNFYDAAGNVEADTLKELLPSQEGIQENMIGWLSYRVGTPLHPSMRESAVTSSLCMQAARQALAEQEQRPAGVPVKLAPVLMLLVSSSTTDHGGATVTLDYRAFQASYASPSHLQQHAAAGEQQQQQPSAPIRLHPVQLVVDNLARHQHRGAYSDFKPYAQPPMGGAAPGQQEALEAAAAAAGKQVAVLETHCDGMLRQLKVLCQQVSEGAGASAALLSENEILLKELDRLQA